MRIVCPRCISFRCGSGGGGRACPEITDRFFGQTSQRQSDPVDTMERGRRAMTGTRRNEIKRPENARVSCDIVVRMDTHARAHNKWTRRVNYYRNRPARDVSPPTDALEDWSPAVHAHGRSAVHRFIDLDSVTRRRRPEGRMIIRNRG